MAEPGSDFETENGRARERERILTELIQDSPFITINGAPSYCFFCGVTMSEEHDERCLWWRAVQVGATEA